MSIYLNWHKDGDGAIVAAPEPRWGEVAPFTRLHPPSTDQMQDTINSKKKGILNKGTFIGMSLLSTYSKKAKLPMKISRLLVVIVLVCWMIVPWCYFRQNLVKKALQYFVWVHSNIWNWPACVAYVCVVSLLIEHMLFCYNVMIVVYLSRLINFQLQLCVFSCPVSSRPVLCWKSNASDPLCGISLLYMIHIFQGITKVFTIFYMLSCVDLTPLCHENDLDSAAVTSPRFWS